MKMIIYAYSWSFSSLCLSTFVCMELSSRVKSKANLFTTHTDIYKTDTFELKKVIFTNQFQNTIIAYHVPV